MEENKVPRRERERLKQRQEMLAAALELFSEKGYHSVTMHEIAQKAEFAIGTLYKFFKNKEDLYTALMREQADKFRAALDRAVEEPTDEVEKLRSYVRTKGELFNANASMIRLYFAENGGASSDGRADLDREMRERHARFLETLASIFESGIKRKRFMKIAEPYHLAVAIESITNAFLFHWLEAPERHPYPENPDTILDILFKGLMKPSP